MKTYDQLTEVEKQKAFEAARVRLLTGVCEGAIRFSGDDLQPKIDAAFKKADAMQMPWFAHEYVMDTCAAEINGMAQCNAEDALYPEADEFCVHGIAA